MVRIYHIEFVVPDLRLSGVEPVRCQSAVAALKELQGTKKRQKQGL